ncbi:hypothetical protein COLO4_29485 [Corchorus olitorius]|uniref:GST N-terminal domain-containing protein n=1 Tax=Corchorus olitorius TaxID=93759 RepID=A0A1R3HEB5_9ROSI|nr:hypothetical protein COLO4_29485 [Corchorus olitorius]
MEQANQEKKLKLYSHWISSCSCRIRIALNLKEFQKLNPIGYVPVLVDGDIVISDSFAIFMKYIAEKVGPDEATPWVKHHIEKGFEGRPVSSTTDSCRY